MIRQENRLYSLIPLEDFKLLLGIDNREEKLARYCLVTSTFTIEQYCKRRLLRKKHTDYLNCAGEHIFTLREYPLKKILSVHLSLEEAAQGDKFFTTAKLVSPEFYYCLPDEGICEDFPFSLVLRPPLRFGLCNGIFRVMYSAGYGIGKVPADLASACLELAAWNMNRYKGRRIGLNGNIRGHGKDGKIIVSVTFTLLRI